MHTFPHVMCGVCIFTMGFEFLGNHSLNIALQVTLLLVISWKRRRQKSYDSHALVKISYSERRNIAHT
jgi:hypothetical protein